jgi:hypothetical protein
MNKLPYLYLKTPIELKYIEDDDCEFEVQTYIETCVYENNNLLDVVIIKNILFDDGYEEVFLLKYIKGLKNLDEVEEICDEVILADRGE